MAVGNENTAQGLITQMRQMTAGVLTRRGEMPRTYDSVGVYGDTHGEARIAPVVRLLRGPVSEDFSRWKPG